MQAGTDYRSTEDGRIYWMENWSRAMELVSSGVAEIRWVGHRRSPYRHPEYFVLAVGNRTAA